MARGNIENIVDRRSLLVQQRMQSLESLIGRAKLAGLLGQSYEGDRNIYYALGYPTSIRFEEYAARYERQDIASAIIDRPVDATWRGSFGLLEADDENETPLEKAWQELEERLHIKSKFTRLDRLSQIGNYGVMFLGLSDAKNKEAQQDPVRGTGLQLLYVKPLSEGSAKIRRFETNPGNERYGLPVLYDLTITSPGGVTNNMLVHYSRIIHVAGKQMESEVDGDPTLKCVYNRLMDIEKLVGGSAEMFWRGARPGYNAKVDEEHSLDDEAKDDLLKQIDEMEHSLRRILVNEGVDMQPLAMQIADPSKHLDIQIQLISAQTGIPKRILVGSERGELASSDDRTTWNEMVKSRREEYAEPQIVRTFVDTGIKYGFLPPAKTAYSVKWNDLFAKSEKEKTEIGKNRAESVSKYAGTPGADVVLPPSSFYRNCLGLDEEEIELIEQEHEEAVKEEEAQLEAERKLMEEQMESNPQPVPGNPQQTQLRRTQPNATGNRPGVVK